MRLVSALLGRQPVAGLAGGGELAVLADPPPDAEGSSPARRLIEATAGDWAALRRWPASRRVPLSEARPQPPVPDPSYVGHCVRDLVSGRYDGGSPLEGLPLLATLPDTVLNHDGGAFELPPWSARIAIHAQLACVLGRRVGPGHPLDDASILGYTLLASCTDAGIGDLIDARLSPRDMRCLLAQFGRWLDGSHPVGPWIVPAAEVEPAGLRVSVAIEGMAPAIGTVPRGAAELLRFLAPVFEFRPGDIIGLGPTSEDLVLSTRPAAPIRVAVTAPGLGTLSFRIEDRNGLRDRWARYRPAYLPEIERTIQDRHRRLGSRR